MLHLFLHTAWTFNRKYEIPRQEIWGRFFLDESKISVSEEVYFIFYEGFRLAYSRQYLKHLRNKYKKCKIIFCFRNPVVGVNMRMIEKWEAIKSFYDAGITLNKYEAEKLRIIFCDYWPCLLPEKNFEPENASDVFFVGQAKDRMTKILSVYERLS